MRHTCERCDMSFPTKSYLREHMFTEHNWKFFMCPYCLLKNSLYLDDTIASLNTHMRKHAGICGSNHMCVDNICDICSNKKARIGLVMSKSPKAAKEVHSVRFLVYVLILYVMKNVCSLISQMSSLDGTNASPLSGNPCTCSIPSSRKRSKRRG